MTAREIVKALGGRWHGAYGTARCPVHDDHEPSLSIRNGVDGEPVFNCFAGCDWRDIKDALRADGLLPERAPGRAPALRRGQTPDAPKRRAVEVGVHQQQRMEFARRKWHEAVPLPQPADFGLDLPPLDPRDILWCSEVRPSLMGRRRLHLIQTKEVHHDR